jgi:cell division septum initiation protein DivIVA
MADRPAPGASADAVSGDLIAHRSFSVSRKGFDQQEVKEFLQLAASAVRSLHQRVEALEASLADAEHRIANPTLDEDTLMRMVGDETGSILRSARAAAKDMSASAERDSRQLRESAEQESAQLLERSISDAAHVRATAEAEAAAMRQAAEHETGEQRARAAEETTVLRETTAREATELRQTAVTETTALRQTAERESAEMRARADAESARVVDEARQQAGDLRGEAETVLARRTEEADQAAARIQTSAQETANQLLERARRDADGLRQQAEHDRKLTIEGAQAVREKILGDLARRRRVASTQIEQLRAGRERLLESYGVVRRTLEEVNDELHRADAEARDAAAAAGRVYEEAADADLVTPDLLSLVTIPLVEVEPSDVESSDVESSGMASAGAESAGVVGEEQVPEAVEVAVEAEVPGEAEAVEAEPVEPEQVEPAVLVETVEPVGVMAEEAAPPAKPKRSRRTTSRQPAAVDDLFARIKAGREDAVAHAKVVLDEPDVPTAAPAAPPSGAESGADTHPDPPQKESRSTGTPGADAREDVAPAAGPAQTSRHGGRSDRDLEPPRSDEEEAWLQRRDEALGRTEANLTRKLKRALQDEQNDLLDRLRSLRGRPTADSLLPRLEDQHGRFALAAAVLVEEGSDRGVHFALGVLGDLGRPVGSPADSANVEDLVEALAGEIVVPLRRRLEQTIAESGDDDQAVLVEALGGAYREWKTQRIERIAGDALAAAFARGSVHATPAGGALRWVVDDLDGPCSDCDDNVLAGGLPRHEAFPTGQLHPPAHAGCRCILVPVLVQASAGAALA